MVSFSQKARQIAAGVALSFSSMAGLASDDKSQVEPLPFSPTTDNSAKQFPSPKTVTCDPTLADSGAHRLAYADLKAMLLERLHAKPEDIQNSLKAAFEKRKTFMDVVAGCSTAHPELNQAISQFRDVPYDSGRLDKVMNLVVMNKYPEALASYPKEKYQNYMNEALAQGLDQYKEVLDGADKEKALPYIEKLITASNDIIDGNYLAFATTNMKDDISVAFGGIAMNKNQTAEGVIKALADSAVIEMVHSMKKDGVLRPQSQGPNKFFLPYPSQKPDSYTI